MARKCWPEMDRDELLIEVEMRDEEMRKLAEQLKFSRQSDEKNKATLDKTKEALNKLCAEEGLRFNEWAMRSHAIHDFRCAILSGAAVRVVLRSDLESPPPRRLLDKERMKRFGPFCAQVNMLSKQMADEVYGPEPDPEGPLPDDGQDPFIDAEDVGQP